MVLICLISVLVIEATRVKILNMCIIIYVLMYNKGNINGFNLFN